MSNNNVIIPAPDSHFRLKDHRCGGQAAYTLERGGWSVKCLGCGAKLPVALPVRHDAQAVWNRGCGE